jgi:hypothetical protein
VLCQIQLQKTVLLVWSAEPIEVPQVFPDNHNQVLGPWPSRRRRPRTVSCARRSRHILESVAGCSSTRINYVIWIMSNIYIYMYIYIYEYRYKYVYTYRHMVWMGLDYHQTYLSRFSVDCCLNYVKLHHATWQSHLDDHLITRQQGALFPYWRFLNWWDVAIAVNQILLLCNTIFYDISVWTTSRLQVATAIINDAWGSEPDTFERRHGIFFDFSGYVASIPYFF